MSEVQIRLSYVIVGHCNSSPELDCYKSIVARGAYVQFDQWASLYPEVISESRGGHYRADYPEEDPMQAMRALVVPGAVDTVRVRR